MRSRLPFRMKQTAHDERQNMVWLCLLLCCYTLHEHFGFGKERMLRFLSENGKDAEKIADMKNDYATNKTWQDELWAWGERFGLNELLKRENW